MSKITELSDEQLDILAEKITLKLTEEQQNEFKKTETVCISQYTFAFEKL